MSAPDALVQAVEAAVRDVAGPGRSPALANAETSLTEGFWLDSAGLFDLVLVCEGRFGVTFDGDADFARATFATVRSLADRIHAKQLAGGRA